MIELKVKKYCENCPLFEPTCKKVEVSNFTETNYYTTVKCEYEYRCEQIAKQIKEVMKKYE